MQTHRKEVFISISNQICYKLTIVLYMKCKVLSPCQDVSSFDLCCTTTYIIITVALLLVWMMVSTDWELQVKQLNVEQEG